MGKRLRKATATLAALSVHCEPVEKRIFLSGTVASAAAPAAVMVPDAIVEAGPLQQPFGSPFANATAPFTPAEIRQFYGINSISFGTGIVGNGSGQTIAVIDAYADTKFVNEFTSGTTLNPAFNSSDLHSFDTNFNLPDPPNFTVIPETGYTSLPTQYNSGWAGETALDVEWSHAMAPAANIILVQCVSQNESDLIGEGISAARAAGATVISMSFGYGDYSGENSYDQYFTPTSGNTNVTYVAAAGDSGVADTGDPAVSPDVVSVGGTSITTSSSSGSFGSEVVWNDGSGATGGGISSYESAGNYQTAYESLSGTHRGVPDVAFDADPSTGVYVLDTSQNGGGGYYQFGGTSLSSPAWAGIVAIADQGAVLTGQTAMNGLSTTLPRLYELPSTVFHDITSGNNTDTSYSSETGHTAGVGYDLVSGRGSPIANVLVPDLAGVATITGRVFVDNNGDGIFDGSDTPIAGKTVYLDLNNSGTPAGLDPSIVTNAQGMYTFTNQAAGGTVRLAAPAVSGYVAVPASASVAYGTTDTINFTYFPLSFNNTAVATNYTIQTDATNTYDQILVNGTLTYSVIKTALAGQKLTFNLTGSGDSFTVNASNGNPLPSGGIALTAGVPLTIIGTATGNDTYNVSSNSVAFDSIAINASSFASITLNPGGGTSSLNVNSGSPIITAQTAGGGVLTRNFSNISIASGSSVLFATAAAHSDHTLVETSTLSDLGQLDLGGNDLIVHNGNLATLTSLLTTGYANGQWNGLGIASAAAHSDSTYLTALGAIQNTIYGGSGQPLFDGTAPLTTDVLIKFTYYGDTNLDGKIDGTDYSRIDNAFGTAASGWFNGDFNFDGVVNGSDYTLIDNDFNTQGASLAAAVATPAAMIARTGTATPTQLLENAPQPSPADSDEVGVETLLLKQDVVDRLNSV